MNQGATLVRSRCPARPNVALDEPSGEAVAASPRYSIHVIFPLWNGLLSTPTSLGTGGKASTKYEQESVTSCVLLLEARGPTLAYPFSSGIEQSRHSHMRELRIQTAEGHTVCSMHLIPVAWRFC